MCDHADVGMGPRPPAIQPPSVVEHQSVLARPNPVGRFGMAAIAWSAAHVGVHPSDPATVATPSGARGTSQRY